MKPITILRRNSDNSSLELVGQIVQYESLVLDRVWNGIGEFELTLNPNTRYADKLEYEHIVFADKGYNKAFIIKYKHLKEIDGREVLVVKGRSLQSIMKKRVTYPHQGDTHLRSIGSAEKVVKDVVDRSFVSTSAERMLSLLTVEVNQDRGKTTSIESRYKEVYEEIVKAAEVGEIGWNIEIDPETKNLIFMTSEGKDRTINQNENSRVIFSPKYKSVGEQEYIRDKYNMKTQAIVGGQGEGIERTIHEVGSTSGWYRDEVFVDARDIAETEGLQDRGVKTLEEFKEILNYESTVLQASAFKYEEDWELGDKVTIMNEKWGLILNARITRVTEVYEGDKIQIKPIFGTKVPTLIDEIKKRYDRPIQ